MSRPIRIILPIFPSKETIYFKGYICHDEKEQIVIYVTEYTKDFKALDKARNCTEDVIFGCSSEQITRKHDNFIKSFINGLILQNHDGNVLVKKLILNGESIKYIEDCIVMLFDYERFKRSETISESTDYFSKLSILLKDDSTSLSTGYEPILNGPSWLSSSMFAQHIFNYVNLINWLFVTVKKERKISIKPGNLVLAILTDIALGFIILELVAIDKQVLSTTLMRLLEQLVNSLYSLLKWLMGSPAGLKLNNAFNKLLGKYFAYHIQLWWMFLDVSREKLDLVLHVYNNLGYLGFTFQAAIISDLISIATCHSYCIYVYAARLFNIQISGLIALLRLFVGRKYNPLRGGIDSCEYTNQELFVGTVAFTILLLLLPTTTMYYVVFTLFRLLSIGVQYTLARLIYLVQTLPLYVGSLWLVRSPRVAGNILLEIEDSKEDAPLVLRVRLLNKSLDELVKLFRPPVETTKQFTWSNVLSNICVGNQIV